MGGNPGYRYMKEDLKQRVLNFSHSNTSVAIFVTPYSIISLTFLIWLAFFFNIHFYLTLKILMKSLT